MAAMVYRSLGALLARLSRTLNQSLHAFRRRDPGVACRHQSHLPWGPLAGGCRRRLAATWAAATRLDAFCLHDAGWLEADGP